MRRVLDALLGPAHPLWLVGFRPFFTLACLAGMLLPLLWVAIYTGSIALPVGALSPVQWHAHEMFYGFGWAVLGGFLLTSTKNWVHVRGYHGHPLRLLAIAWLVERAGMWLHGRIPMLLFAVTSNLFLVSIVLMLLYTLVRYRKSDTFADNALFMLILPVFLIAKNLMLSATHFSVGTSMTVGLFRMAFLIMLERTMTQFMRNAFGVTILRRPILDGAIKLLGLMLVAESLMPPALASGAGLLLAVLLVARLLFWRPHLALGRLDLGVMVLGYLAIAAQLVVLFLNQRFHTAWVGTVAMHTFAFGVMGLIIPAMLVRICNGHTGRKLVFATPDRLALWAMMLGFGLRIVAPQLAPAGYLYWLWGAAACWFTCFVLLSWRYIPLLAQPRIDGKEH